MQQFINYWSAALTAPATADIADTSLSIASATGDLLPALGVLDQITMTLFERDESSGEEIRREIVRCYAYADGMLQVDRAQEGTVAQAWAAGMRIEVRLTAEVLARIFTDVAILQRSRVYSEDSSVTMNNQQGAYVLWPPANAAQVFIGFEYASEEKGAILNDVEIYPPDSAEPFVLTLPAGSELLCELPGGSVVTTTEFSTHEVTLPAAELYLLEFRGVDNIRLRITTKAAYQLLA